MKKIIKEALARNMQVIPKPIATVAPTLPQIKKVATKSKKFTKLQHDSNLDVTTTGTIVPPVIPTLPKRAIKKPSYLNDYT
jgi:hypothetical protein